MKQDRKAQLPPHGLHIFLAANSSFVQITHEAWEYLFNLFRVISMVGIFLIFNSGTLE